MSPSVKRVETSPVHMPHPAVTLLAIAGGAKALDYLTTSSHDWLLKKAYKTADTNTSTDADLYVDHIDPWGATGNPEGVLDCVEGVPDLIVQDFPTTLIVEVEDADSLQRPGHVIEQLERFSKKGARRVLVVPDAEETLTVAEEIADEVAGSVVVAPPSGLHDLL